MTAVEPKPTTPERVGRVEPVDAPVDAPVVAPVIAPVIAPVVLAASAPPVTRRRETRWLLAGLAFLVGAVIVGASIGPAGPAAWRVPLALLDHLPLISVDSGVTDADWNIVWQIRLPRVVLGGLVGAMLSVAGASYQGVFRNPLVDPYLLGAAAGAGLGATLILTTGRDATAGWPVDPVQLVAFAFALGTVAITYSVGASFGGKRNGATLVLAGVAVVSFATAIQTFLLQRNLDVVREVFQWVLGRLSGATWSDVVTVTPYVVVSVVVLMLHRRHLDVFRVGDDEATTLGISVPRTRLIIVVAATLGTAAVVSVSGLIGFVGLVVPHVVRLMAGASYRLLIPLSLLFGGGFLILADVAGRQLMSPAETPIGVVTAFVGAPFFLYLLRTRKVI
jgi:iron complex transport system permease protein